MIKTILISALVAVVIVFGVNYLLGMGSQPTLGGATIGMNHYETENFLQGLVIGNRGTALSKVYCATATWNPGSVASSGATQGGYVTSTDIALAGAVMGDTCSASLSSATSSGLSTDCTVTNTATATIALYNISSGAIDPATGTAKVCYTH